MASTSGPAEKKRPHGRSSPLLNGFLVASLFLALVQIFDPSGRTEGLSENTALVEHLTDFANGLDGVKKGNEEASIARLSLGREKILTLLAEAGAKDLTAAQIEKLPTWQQFVDLYDDEVVIVGKDRCSSFVESVGGPQEVIVGIAGLFNTGTNLLQHHLHKNVKAKSAWQVPWGKHRLADVKWEHTAEHMDHIDKHKVFPIVVVRDPYSWLQSMCSHPYSAVWRHGAHHCPNLVPNDGDRQHYKGLHETFALTIKFSQEVHVPFDNLIDTWNVWYRQYLESAEPRLIIRFEDLIFKPQEVLKEIAACVKSEVADPITYRLETSKPHGSGTDYIKALTKTADGPKRQHNMTSEDLVFADTHLDSELMSLFHYHTIR